MLSSWEMVGALWGLQPGLEPPVLVAFDVTEDNIWVEHKLWGEDGLWVEHKF